MDQNRHSSSNGGLGFLEVTAIGIGGMVGGGIFAVLGLAVQLAQGGTPLAFALAGVVALLAAYSYARLSVAFPSQGGTVTFLDTAFGPGLLTGGLNILLWLSYIVMLALYAYAFGSYGTTFLPSAWQSLGRYVLTVTVIVVITVLNLLSAKVIGEVENWIVGVKLAILVLFIGVGIWRIDPSRLTPHTWSPLLHLVAGGFVIFVAYEGFELIANSAQDTQSPRKTLPRAYYTSVLAVLAIYILIALVTVGTLSLESISKARDYALAEAAKPTLGDWGFRLIAMAALLSTTSAINATLYGAARLSYIIAVDGELPAILEKKVWHEPVAGLLITSLAAILVATLFPLSRISIMGSSGFLIIFSAVHWANHRLAQQTESRRWLIWTGLFSCLLALAALIWQTATTNPANLLVLVIMVLLSFGLEWGFRRFIRSR